MLEELARRHGLRVRVLDVDETGWDFRVGHAVDAAGVRWVLRVPRRTEVAEQLEVERRLLAYLRTRLRVRLPEWEICSPELVAYRRLPGRPLAPEHPETLEYQWWTEAPAEFFTVLGEGAFQFGVRVAVPGAEPQTPPGCGIRDLSSHLRGAAAVLARRRLRTRGGAS